MRISNKEYLRLNETIAELRREFAILQEILVRVVEAQRTITIDFVDEIPDGQIVWDTVQTESGSKQMTIWFAVSQGQEQNGKVSATN